MAARCGILLLILAGICLSPAHAQLFADDAARALARKNESELESIKAVVRELNQSLILSKESQARLTQRNQQLEEQLRSLTGAIEDLQQQLRAAAGDRSNADRAALTLMEKQIADLAAQLNQDTADLKNQLQSISRFVTLPPEDDVYAAAYAQYKEGNIEQAVQGFNQVLEFYPDGQFSANCHYWLGQAYLAQENFPRARRHAETLLDNYSPDSKTPAAMLILAQSFNGLGLPDDAQRQLQRLVDLYPTSLAADSARQLLIQ